MARTLGSARRYVKNQASSSISHRSLRSAGEGHPGDGSGWVGAVADKPERPAWLDEPVIWPEETVA